MDVLNVWGDIHPRVDLEVVEGLDTGSVAGTKHGLRKRAELVAGTDEVPADAELIAALLADQRAAFYSVLTEEVLGRLLSLPARCVAVQHVGFSEAAVAVFEREFVDGPSLGRACRRCDRGCWSTGTVRCGSWRRAVPAACTPGSGPDPATL